MRTLIVCESVHHGNTEKVAAEMIRVLGAELARPEKVSAGDLAGYDLVGFGSGIYAWRHHGSLLELADSLPTAGGRAFIFSTRGTPVRWGMHRALRKRLLRKGFEIVGEFSCLGFDTVGPLEWIGGVNRGRPDGRDLKRARSFAQGLKEPGAQPPRRRESGRKVPCPRNSVDQYRAQTRPSTPHAQSRTRRSRRAKCRKRQRMGQEPRGARSARRRVGSFRAYHP